MSDITRENITDYASHLEKLQEASTISAAFDCFVCGEHYSKMETTLSIDDGGYTILVAIREDWRRDKPITYTLSLDNAESAKSIVELFGETNAHIASATFVNNMSEYCDALTVAGNWFEQNGYTRC